METLANKELIEKTSLFLNLPRELLNTIDLFLSNTDLTKIQQEKLLMIMEDVYGRAFLNGMKE